MNNEISIYLAHALTKASPQFLHRMVLVREALERLPMTTVLRFAWIDGVGPRTDIENIYTFDIGRVRSCSLLVGVAEEQSDALWVELHERCVEKRPFMLFVPKGYRISRFIADAIKAHRLPLLRDPRYEAQGRELRDPIEFSCDEDIINLVAGWVRDHLPKKTILASQAVHSV